MYGSVEGQRISYNLDLLFCQDLLYQLFRFSTGSLHTWLPDTHGEAHYSTCIPGIYYRSELDHKGISIYTGTIISDWAAFNAGRNIWLPGWLNVVNENSNSLFLTIGPDAFAFLGKTTYGNNFPILIWHYSTRKKIRQIPFFENYVIIMRTTPTTSRPGISTIEEKSVGRIDQIIGPVLDITFPPGKLPDRDVWE
ncbi:hypothetical protein ACJX0J_040891 [Zea mays]